MKRSTYGLAILFLLLTTTLSTAQDWPGEAWATATPGDVGMSKSSLERARDYALQGGGSGFITRHGKLVMSWGDVRRRYDLKSTTKSIGVTALGLAIADGKIRLGDKANKYHPTFGTPPNSNSKTGWLDEVTVLHLATQTAGFAKPGGYQRLMFRPGKKWAYSDGGPNWLAECITLQYKRDVQDLLFERVFTPIGVSKQDLQWRRNAYREAKLQNVARREFGSGISANVDAMARIGYLYLREGQWKERQLLPRAFVKQARSTQPDVVGLPVVDPQDYGSASDHYGLLWWNNADGALPDVPRDAYWSWGLYDSLIVVIPSLDLVVTRAGRSLNRRWDGHYDVLRPFLNPIVASVTQKKEAEARVGTAHLAPQRPVARARSPVIKEIRWAPADSIRRAAHGGDNWPLTSGADDRLYTAYGDGRGFRPFVDNKLSMGLATIRGEPDSFRGVNLSSPSAERRGDGKRGPKVSGILMVDSVLYMLIRNTDNSQLAWSTDQGRSWTWADWRFKTSFGYATFLNYGKNYDGARDDYVYIYSHDSNSAYERADRMVLARVPQGQLRNRQDYEFLSSLKPAGPEWTKRIDQRGAVFTSPGKCYRSSVVYNTGLKRYLWCQTGLGKDTRHAGGFAIYDAPEPWGPWTTVYETDRWDVGPGETSTLPTKWMSKDGRTMHMVFSGDDAFSVRKAILTVNAR